jgi:signal transduction histidine kinase
MKTQAADEVVAEVKTHMTTWWAEVSREIATAVQSGDVLDPLRVIAQRAMEVAEAEQAILLLAGPADPAGAVVSLVVSAAVGKFSDELVARRIPVAGSVVGTVFRSGEPLIGNGVDQCVQNLAVLSRRSTLVVPLGSHDQSFGVIVMARNQDQAAFTRIDVELICGFADYAATALSLAAAPRLLQESSVINERERIARDLNDRVIQRLFAVGLDLQSVCARIPMPQITGRVEASISELQQIISEIRRSVFDIKPRTPEQHGLALRIQETVSRYTDRRSVKAILQITGHINAVPPHLADDIEAVVAEALSDAVLRSDADTVTIAITVADDLRVEVSDNGSVRAADTERTELFDKRIYRSQRSHGRCEVVSSPDTGTTVSWTAQVGYPAGDGERRPPRWRAAKVRQSVGHSAFCE